MKKTKLFILTLISTIIFFPACSNKSEKIKKTSISQPVSVYNIMGISEPKNEIISIIDPVHESINYPNIMALNQPKIEENIVYPEPYISPDIEFISYQKSPIEQVYSSVNNNMRDLLNGIEWKAKSFLGTPYVWGATGPSTFDCSGFTQWVYRDSGINIPRVSRDQAKVGEYVRYENLQRGDMVFFDTKKRRSGKVTHVGIYLGNNNFIHASSAGKKVVIYNFNKKEYYKKRFLWGRRVTNKSMHYAYN